jgi:hypothetical protein
VGSTINDAFESFRAEAIPWPFLISLHMDSLLEASAYLFPFLVEKNATKQEA